MNSTLHAGKITLVTVGVSRLSQALSRQLAGEGTKVIDSGYTLR